MSWFLGLTLLLAAAALTAPLARRVTESLWLAAEIAGLRPLPAGLDFRPGYSRRALTYEIEGRTRRADLYLPEGARPEAAIVFVPGAAEGGKDDPRVVAFARALARARFAVLVPDIEALRRLELLPDSAEDVADALAWLTARPELVPAGRLGVLTTSVGVGPACLAIVRPAWAGRVRFFVTIGGYYDLPRTLVYLTTGHYAAHGVRLKTTPREYGKWVYALSAAARLEDPVERAALQRLARRRLAEANADVRDELARLGQSARRIYAFVENHDPARATPYMAALPARVRADISALNLAEVDLSGVSARFLVVHGVDDDLIPYGEAIAFAAALGPRRARLFLLTGFYHVDVVPRPADLWRLVRAISALLAERRL
jgi:pimeloyl-ACP methyl ester carboxylesterase